MRDNPRNVAGLTHCTVWLAWHYVAVARGRNLSLYTAHRKLLIDATEVAFVCLSIRSLLQLFGTLNRGEGSGGFAVRESKGGARKETR